MFIWQSALATQCVSVLCIEPSRNPLCSYTEELLWLMNLSMWDISPIDLSSFLVLVKFLNYQSLCVIIIRPTRRENLRESAYAKRWKVLVHNVTRYCSMRVPYPEDNVHTLISKDCASLCVCVCVCVVYMFTDSKLLVICRKSYWWTPKGVLIQK